MDILAKRVDRLRTLFDSPRDQVRWEAGHVLARLGKRAASAVPTLVRMLDDSDREVRRSAIQALGKIGVARPLPWLELIDVSDPLYPEAHLAIELIKRRY